MISNMDEFDREIEREIKVPETMITDLHKQAARDFVLVGAVTRTPVDEDRGEARGGWNTTEGAPSDEPTNRLDTSGVETIEANLAVIDRIRSYTRSFTQNPVKHASILDMGLFQPPNPGPSKDPRPQRRGRILVSGGYSTQAPRGMVGITFDEVEAKYRRIAEGL